MNVTAYDIGLEGLDALQGVDALCLFVGEDDRPLPGSAGYVDWRMCGSLSRILQSGFFVGALEDSLLMPTDGRFSVPRVFIIGLGQRRGLDASSLGEALANAGRVLAKARVEAVALEIPGVGSLDEGVRASALTEKFLPNFKGRAVAVLADKELARRLPGKKS
ncbi:M17 family peptidase N-terminal domain-containing protein [Vitiosangium sp. GDMCC 1.1324]|uniref:M17 family peptidase N-terminal domain-containing protein n=1 Tax=Vitiosangium sp. (strain GDMCC 1.1324) TaxID=2138576 RepID=UPI000D3496C9|nr:M17 family peptidase N-terminal domain-containing protein [Vitiosangium sp. GDMCC 1.1324]PTL82393.1 peptidase M17 [Vitiosangium sp. GDMCC 1.1324]